MSEPGWSMADIRRRAERGLGLDSVRAPQHDYCDDHCPKCGFRDVKVTYVRNLGRESLHHFCNRCQYGWDKPTLDNAQKGAQR
jgi:hypothetical protein